MTRDERTVSLAVLLLIVYAVLNFVQSGMLIIPFPLNEVIFFMVTIIFAIRHYKYSFFTALFSCCYAVLAMLTSEFFWSFFMSEEQFDRFFQSSSPDVIALMSNVVLLIWSGVQLIRPENKLRSAFFLLFFLLMSSALILSEPILMIITLLIPFTLQFKYKDLAPFHMLWLLQAVLMTMKEVMLLLA
ncbi:MAG: hypothetical protein EP305_05640 [Bacteroidetes bacterium]|nr:MAG: hypothetical protein EP305_05640 [Bacteroidota bacterium]